MEAKRLLNSTSRVNRHTYINTDRHTHRQTHRQTDTHTHRHTHRQTQIWTNWLIENMGPEGRCFENPTHGRHLISLSVLIVPPTKKCNFFLPDIFFANLFWPIFGLFLKKTTNLANVFLATLIFFFKNFLAYFLVQQYALCWCLQGAVKNLLKRQWPCLEVLRVEIRKFVCLIMVPECWTTFQSSNPNKQTNVL